ncbi:MAG: bifunctional diguanylate cyclase/phosphodiesterase [Proteobacteria bacterium]|nr:bifunctional diguanylate cyclase/phosphodiesterase [Pseudomonadota bacterium]
MAAFLKRRRDFGWIPTVVVLAVVLIAGSRLMYLSVQHHAATARAEATKILGAYASKIDPELQKLGVLAFRQAAAAGKALANTNTFTSLDSVPLQSNTFWMTNEDRVSSSLPADANAAAGIASEWDSAESARPVPGATVLGPLRLGSQWLVAARVPVVPAIAGVESPSRGWAVSYGDLDEMISGAHLARLTDAGYDFELSQVEPRSARTRIFVSSSSEPLADAVAIKLRLPNGFQPATAGSYLQVAILPRTGWYPATELASDIGLLAFLAWLLAFGTHDLSHALQRSRSALTAARARLRNINKQLATEMQQRLSLQETFDHARFHDAFTGLPNRRYFMDQLDRALRDVRTKRRQRVAVIIVDISRFKLVNDMLGHTAGDELMVQAARRFEKSTSAVEGVLARWGGDQFAVLILDVASTDSALGVAGVLQDELRSPFELRRHKLVVTATIGVTTVDSGQQRAEDVVREADIALSVAKRQENQKIVLYSANMAGQAASLVSLEADLHVALEKHELRLLFQPVVDLRTYRMVGAEALLRWRHPVESVLAPDKFIRIAEEAGLMVPITRWIILRVIKLAGEWLRRLPANQKFFVSVNMSPTALRDPGMVEYIGSLLRETQLPPSVLKFELTEAALISNVGAARETLERLHAMGIGLMLDDFGTGYSSLSYLQLFPFDFVKIDRPFVNTGPQDNANTGMMAAMVQMAGSLNLTAIAEIIETEAAARALQEMGCEYGQGYYFSEPIEAELALQRLRTQHPFQPTVNTGTFAPVASTAATAATAASPDETVAVKPLDVDDSPTIMIPATSLGFPPPDDDSR